LPLVKLDVSFAVRDAVARDYGIDTSHEFYRFPTWLLEYRADVELFHRPAPFV